jgi:chromosome partitioning protein
MSRYPAAASFISNKGGTGKTTSVLSVAAAIAAAGGRVLVIDMDQQRNATILLGPTSDQGPLYTILDVTASSDPTAVTEACYPSEWSLLDPFLLRSGKVDVLPGDDRFSEIHISQYGVTALRHAVAHLALHYDMILFDCPPSTGLVVQAALNASKQVVMVSQPEHLSTIGLNQMRILVDEFNTHSSDWRVAVSGVLVTQFVAQQIEHKAALTEIRDAFGTLLWEPVIPYRAVVQRASAAHYPLLAYPDPMAQQLSALYATAALRLLAAYNLPELDGVLGVLSMNAGFTVPVEVT